jgi:hypothetical protein
MKSLKKYDKDLVWLGTQGMKWLEGRFTFSAA